MIYHQKLALIIPARMKSTRLPGKVLKKICNKTILERVYAKCSKVVKKKNIFIATPDQEIINFCKSKNFLYIKTSAKCLTGTDRVSEVATKLSYLYFINVQADELFLNNQNIINVYKELIKKKYAVVNCFKPIRNKREYYSKTVPKVVFNKKNELLYMSRAGIPSNKKQIFRKAYKQICVYGFNKSSLTTYNSQRKKTFLESQEDIEILRFLELGIKVKMLKGTGSKLSVDTIDDYNLAKKLIRS
jgi:3-deoxy-manno-octulosonate cytidylyltransferase (CMP-KDO synthetase)